MNAKSLFARARTAFEAHGPKLAHPATGVLLAFMIVAGVVLRIQNYGYPFHTSFDEFQYTDSAHQFLIGGTDPECCHPPLSKLLVAVGMILLGNNGEGWRYMSLVFGLQSMVLAYLMGKALFADKRAGWLAAALMAADGFYLSYSRSALADIFLSGLMQWAVFAAVVARGWAGVLTSAVLVGLAASVKWVGLLAALPACLAIILCRRVPWYSMVSFAVVPGVHLLVWMLGLHLIHLPNDPVSVFDTIMLRKSLHLGFPHGANPLESSWYTWLVLWHPLVVKTAVAGGKVRLASSVSNPVLALAAHSCLVVLPVFGAAAAFSAPWRARWKRVFDAQATKGVVILGASWLASMLLWMSGQIVTYWYHYLTAWGFGIILLAGVVSRLDRLYPKGVLRFVVAVLAIAIYFVPVWAEFPISRTSADHRLIFHSWR